MPPTGQSVWMALMTTPLSTMVPGCICGGEFALAEEHGWGSEAFRKGFAKAFREVCAKGMAKVDWKARFVWLPNAFEYNEPASPNVIRGWKTHWDEIPECPLKTEAYHSLKASAEGMGEGFAKAFREACPHPSANQEQEQEQEQEYKSEREEQLALDGLAPKEDTEADKVREVYLAWRKHHPRAPKAIREQSKTWKLIVARLADFSVAELIAAIEGCHRIPFNLGKNDDKRQHLSLGLILRDSEHVVGYSEAADPIASVPNRIDIDPRLESLRAWALLVCLPAPDQAELEAVDKHGGIELAQKLGAAHFSVLETAPKWRHLFELMEQETKGSSDGDPQDTHRSTG